jgi:Tfp pilus assembly protein PilE
MAFEDWFIARARVSSKPHRKVKMDDKMTFFQQLATLVSSGTPLLQAIEICAEQSQSLKLQRALQEIASRVAAGSSLHVAAAGYSHIFQRHWIEVIRTGEITGQMSMVLLELNRQIRESRETHRKVVGSLMYPVILIIVAVSAVAAMLWLVVPTVIGVLIAMSIPSYQRAVEQARADLAVANLRAIWSAERLFWIEHHAYTADLSALRAMGLLDPQSVLSATGYVYSVGSADGDTFSAAATRTGSSRWTGEYAIDQTGSVSGAISAPGEPQIVPGFL